MRGLRFAALGVGLCVAASAAAADKPWVEVKSEHFTVLSNDGDKSARQLAWQLEQVRATFQALWPWAKLQSGQPLVAFALKDEASMKALAPQYWLRKGGVRPVGVSVSGSDRHFMAMQMDVDRRDSVQMNPYFTVYHGYFGIVMGASLDYQIPFWLHNGLIELFANTIVQDKAVLIGPPIPWHFDNLRRGWRMTLAELMAVGRRSPEYLDADRRRTFDAESWALTHYLMFGNGGANFPRFVQLMQMLSKKTDPETAIKESFGGLDQVEGAFGAYLTRQIFSYRKADLAIDLKSDSFTTRKLSPAEIAAEQAAFHVAMRRPVEAQALIDEIKKADVQAPAGFEAEGLLLDSQGKHEEAGQAYAHAVELHSTNFYTHYRHARSLWTAMADKATLGRVSEAAQRSVELNGDYSWSRDLLAQVQTALGETEPAIASARQAVILEPGRAAHRITLARAYGRAGLSEPAQREATTAVALAEDDEDRQRAQAVLDDLAKKPNP